MRLEDATRLGADAETSRSPRLTIALPVYNGEEFLADALDALLGQTFTDFELIVSDNASTDATAEICRDYARRDPRIRYVRQPMNLGCAGNHNITLDLARGELFKWASDDDLYGRDLLERCIEVLDSDPEVVLSHSWSARMDGDGRITKEAGYDLQTDSPDPVVRFRSMLLDIGGDDDYGVIRTAVLRRVAPYNSYWKADRTVPAELALYGRFRHVPAALYFRRDHDGSMSSQRSVRHWCASQDPRRANRLVHPLPRLLTEYVLGYVRAIRNAPLSAADRRRCFAELGRWVAKRAAKPGRFGQIPAVPYTDRDLGLVDSVVARGPRTT